MDSVDEALAVVNLPYSHNNAHLLYSAYILMQQFANIKIRLRIRANQTASSLAVYEAVYTYCPTSAVMVTSRHNI